MLTHNIVGLVMDLFQPNAVLRLCFIGCEQEYGTDQCIEGINPTVAKFMQIPISLIPPLCAFLGTTWTVGVFNTVREQERRMSRYSFDKSPCFQKKDEVRARTSITSAIPEWLALSHMNHKKTKAVAIQALCYCAAYLNSFIGALVWTITRLVYELNREKRLSVSSNFTGLYVALLIVFSVHPLLGFLSWLTYVRPIINSIRKAFPGKSRLWCYGKLLMGDQASRSSRTPHHTTTRPPTTPTVGDQDTRPPSEQARSGSIELEAITTECSCQTEDVIGVIREDNSHLVAVQSTSIANPVRTFV